MKDLTPEQKRAFENTAEEVAYKCGNFTLYVQTVDDGYDYTLYDKHLRAVDGGVYDDPTISMSDAIDYITKDFVIVGMGGVEDRTAPMLDAAEIRAMADEIASSQLADTMFERQFEQTKEDAYAVYQLIDSEHNRSFRYENIAFLERNSIDLDKGNYQNVYASSIPISLKDSENGDILNYLWSELNNNHPLDFTGHSLSVSDVVALKRSGEVSYHYVDSFGFKDVPFYDTEKLMLEHTAENVPTFSFALNAKENPQALFETVSQDPALFRTLETVLAVSNLNDNLAHSYSFEQLSNLHSYCRDVWLKYEGISLEQVSDFACNAINQGVADIDSISKFTKKEFHNALSNDDVSALATANVIDLQQAINKGIVKQAEVVMAQAYAGAANYTEGIPEELHGEDRFYLNPENGSLMWLYYNPDANDNPQFVQNAVTATDILQASKATSNPKEFLYDNLDERADQLLGGIGTLDYVSMRAMFMSGKHNLSGNSKDTMQSLIAFAENHLKTAEMSSEQNYNQIDGIINNEPPKTEKSPKDRPSVLKALREIKPEEILPKENKTKEQER